jgi:hypothetical protein
VRGERSPSISTGVALALVVSVMLACKDRPRPAPPAPAAPTTRGAGVSPAKPPAAPERGEVQAGRTASGLPQRGIVRNAPSFGGQEVARLDSGTAIAILDRARDGWLEIGWPYPSGTRRGFIHRDVVQTREQPSTARSAPAAAGPRPGGPCTEVQGSTTATCRCPDGKSSTMVCLPRPLTWSACDCPKPAPKLPQYQPDQKGLCTADSDCRAPYRCGFQGNCMLL